MQRTFVLGPYSVPSLALTAATRAGLALANALERAAPRVVRHADLSYGETPRQRLDVYAPRSGQSRPLAVFVHGGNWTYFGKDDFRFVGAALAERGIVTVVPSYRRYPTVGLDDQLLDVAHAVRWAREHAARFGADPARLHLVGHSSGAHVAALLAYDAERLARVGGTPQWLAGFVGIAGPYWFATTANPHMRTFFGPARRQDTAQPVRFASSRAPRTLLVHGGADRMVRPRNSRELARRLAACGAPVELRCVPHDGHGSALERWTRPRRRNDALLDAVVRFVAGEGTVACAPGAPAAIMGELSPAGT